LRPATAGFLLFLAAAPARAAERVAVMAPATPGIPDEQGRALAQSVTGVLAAEAARLGYEVISSDDIAALLSMERRRQLVGCEDASCLAEIGGALGVPLMVNGSLGRVGGTYSLALTLIDTAKAAVRGRFQGGAGSEEAVVATARRGAAVLFGRAADASGAAVLLVRTNPPGGAVSLDGRAVGTEPVTLDEVPAGDHVLTAERGGVRGRLSVMLAAGTVERVTVELEAATPVKVKILSNPPDARVHVDGREIGRTPVIAEAAAGEHRVRVELEGHFPWEETRRFSADEYERQGTPYKIDARLRRLVRPLSMVLVAGATTSPALAARGVAGQVELGFDARRWLELSAGYVHPLTGMLTGRFFLVRGTLEFALIARAGAFAAERARTLPPGAALAAGASLGGAVETGVGALGVRLEAVVNRDLRGRGSFTYPFALAAFWRM